MTVDFSMHSGRSARTVLGVLALGLWLLTGAGCADSESDKASRSESATSEESTGGDPAGSTPESPASPETTSSLRGPDLDTTREAIRGVADWMSRHRFHPTENGLPDFRDFALEVRTWYLLYLFEVDPRSKATFLEATRERLELLGDGGPLVTLLRPSPIKKYIGDLLIVMNAARGVDVSIPKLEAALPEFIQAGLDTAPNRPVGLRIPLSWLIYDLGFEIGPTVEDLRPDGMLGTEPPETSMSQIAVYILTHEIYGFSDYGLRSMDLNPKERAYVNRVLPFWTAFFAEQRPNADLCAELINCLQVAGLTHTSEYGRGMRFLLSAQTEEGYFRMPSSDASLHELVHAAMVGAHALLAHEAILTGRGLPLDQDD